MVTREVPVIQGTRHPGYRVRYTGLRVLSQDTALGTAISPNVIKERLKDDP